MKKVVKQVAGIDVAQEELVVTLGRMYEDLTAELYANKVFDNTVKGFTSLIEWTKKLSDAAISVAFVMEATGVYHESLAYFLDEKGLSVSIVLPNKISNYGRSLEVKTITDKTSSEIIARFGLERKQERWKRPKEIYRRLRKLTREREQLVLERTMLKNQMHAEQSEADPSKESMKRMNERIKVINQQEKQVKAEVNNLLKTDEDVQAVMLIICSIPGIGSLTGATVLAETNGFDLIRNKKQITSYAGLDVKEKQSGTSVKGKAKISKRGNRYLRKAMYFPAMTAVRHDERFKSIYQRLVAKHGIKMKAQVAIQRKLLEMAYTLYKNNIPYDKHYLSMNANNTEVHHTLPKKD